MPSQIAQRVTAAVSGTITAAAEELKYGGLWGGLWQDAIGRGTQEVELA